MIHSKTSLFVGALAAVLALPLVHACHSSEKSTASGHEAREESDEQDEDSKGEESLEMAKVPEHVRAGAQKYFADLSACKASKEMEHDAQVYEIVGKGEGGRAVSLNISSAGSVYEVEREIGNDAVPAEVRAALSKHFGDATVRKTEAIELHYYEFQVTKGGKNFEVRITGAGQVMEEEN